MVTRILLILIYSIILMVSFVSISFAVYYLKNHLFLIKNQKTIQSFQQNIVEIGKNPSQSNLIINPNIPSPGVDTSSRIIQKKSTADVHVGIIVVSSKETATLVEKEIAGGNSFEDLAKKYSNGPNKAIGGNIGFVNPKDLDHKISVVLESLSKNTISHIIETDNTFVLIKKYE